jgi:DNA repair exonuclease SbcCD ATPase subunit
MIEFQSIKFKNFLSFGNVETEVSLTSKKVTLLMGENLDEGGSSGSGKSTLISAISYALYDKVPSKISKDKLINRNNDDKKNVLMEVELTFKKDNDIYIVKRTRGSSVSMSLKKNGDDITAAVSAAFNEEIVKLVGLSYDLFCTLVIFRGKSVPFLELPVSRQRSIIEELFKITTLSAKASSLAKEISATKTKVEIEKRLLEQQQNQIKTHNKHIESIAKKVEDWEVEKVKLSKDLNDRLALIEKTDFANQEKLILEKIQLEKESFEIDSALSSITKDLLMLERDANAKRKELSHLVDDKCPYCLQDFAGAEAKINIITEELSDIETVITGMCEEKAKLINNLSIKAESIGNISKDIFPFKDLASLNKGKAEKTILSEKINSLASSSNPHVETLTTLLDSDTLKIDEEPLNSAVKLLEHQQFLHKLLMDKNSFIRKMIINRTIPFLNKRIAINTEKVNLPHSVIFQPDMSCEISQYSKSLDHGNLSDGESVRLNIALCFSFRDVLSFLHNKVNILFTDEIDGGSLCAENVKFLSELIKEKSWEDKISIFSVSHSQAFQDSFDNRLIIRKENGFSSVCTE